MKDKLLKLAEEFAELETEMSKPEVIANQDAYQKLLSRRREIEPAVQLFKQIQGLEQTIEESELMLSDEDEGIREMAKEELKSAKDELEKANEALKLELAPKDPNDSKNCIMEIRAGTGGTEAAIFAEELGRVLPSLRERKGLSNGIY